MCRHGSGDGRPHAMHSATPLQASWPAAQSAQTPTMAHLRAAQGEQAQVARAGGHRGERAARGDALGLLPLGQRQAPVAGGPGLIGPVDNRAGGLGAAAAGVQRAL